MKPPRSLRSLPPEGALSGFGRPGATEIAVEVAYAAAPHDVRLVTLQLPAGATVADALRESRLLDGLAAEVVDALKPAVWGRLADPQAPLRDGDRVELTRGLLVDPKEARRQRYKRDGTKTRKKRAPQGLAG